MGHRQDDVLIPSTDQPTRDPYPNDLNCDSLSRERSSHDIVTTPERTRDIGYRDYRDRLSPDRSAKDHGGSRPTVDSPRQSGYPGYENNRRYRHKDTSSSILDSPPTEFHPDRLMHGNGDIDPHGFDKPSRKPRGVVTRGDQDDGTSRRYGDNVSSSNKHHLDPSSAAAFGSHSRQRLDSSLRNDSLSSDPSDYARPSPPKPHRHRNGGKRQSSMSSSDDGIQTTPEGTSAEEQELESESISEKGRWLCSQILLGC